MSFYDNFTSKASSMFATASSYVGDTYNHASTAFQELPTVYHQAAVGAGVVGVGLAATYGLYRCFRKYPKSGTGSESTGAAKSREEMKMGGGSTQTRDTRSSGVFQQSGGRTIPSRRREAPADDRSTRRSNMSPILQLHVWHDRPETGEQSIGVEVHSKPGTFSAEEIKEMRTSINKHFSILPVKKSELSEDDRATLMQLLHGFRVGWGSKLDAGTEITMIPHKDGETASKQCGVLEDAKVLMERSQGRR